MKVLGKDSCCSHGLTRRYRFLSTASLEKSIPQFCLKKQSLVHLTYQSLEVMSSGSRLGSSQEKLGIQTYPFLAPSNLLLVFELSSDSPKVCFFRANIFGFGFSNYSGFCWGISWTITLPVYLRSPNSKRSNVLPQKEGGGSRQESSWGRRTSMRSLPPCEGSLTWLRSEMWLCQGFCHAPAPWLQVILQLRNCRDSERDGLACALAAP